MKQKPFVSSFDEAEMEPNLELVDKETLEFQKKSNPNAAKALLDAIDAAINGDLTDLKKIRSLQTKSPFTEGINYHDKYFNYENDKVLVRYYNPSSCPDPSKLPMFIFIHGGGWCHSSVEQRNYLLSKLSIKCNMEITSINYSLSPDVKCGRSIDECIAIYADIVKKSTPNRLIFLSGDSSGGNIATSVLYKLSKENKGIRFPNALLLFYPVIDLYNEYPSHKIFETGFGLSLQGLKKCTDAYIPDIETRKDPLYSPILGDISSFPPSLVITSQFDVLRSEGLAFAKKLDESGVPVRYICMKTAQHGFFSTGGVHIENLTEVGLSHIEDFLKIFIK